MERKIIQIFETLKKRRYRRDKPFLEDKLKEIIKQSIEQNNPIKLVGFWGVGQKDKTNWADTASCEFLYKLNEEIKKVYSPGIEYTFIFAAIHGVHNGIDPTVISSYTQDIKNLFDKHDFKYIYLDNLWNKYGINFEKIDKIFDKKHQDWWNSIENTELIEKNAKNRNLRLNPKIAAQKYYIMRDLEKEMFEKEFPDSIFHTFSDSRLRCVLPNMPTLYFYSRKGWSDAPWFVTEEKIHPK